MADRPLVPATLGEIINKNDPDSVAIGNLYVARRQIPAENIVAISIPFRNDITGDELASAAETLRKINADRRFQGLALAWQRPYRVGEQSITSYITEGPSSLVWDRGCIRTTRSAVFDSPSGSTLAVPVSMLLMGGLNQFDSRNLVDRAGRGDGAAWPGTVYNLVTPDGIRSRPREPRYAASERINGDKVRVVTLKSDRIEPQTDVLGFHTGQVKLTNVDALRFREGAYADNLTSYGGRMFNSNGQSTVIDFMRAGATASFGTVREPCNFPEKFPDPAILLRHYLAGETLVEAYWKSVATPTEGLFVGEPLARPYFLLDAVLNGTRLTLRKNAFTPVGRFHLATVETGSAMKVDETLIVVNELKPVGSILAEMEAGALSPASILALVPVIEP